MKKSQQREASRQRRRDGLPRSERRSRSADPAAEAAAAAGEAAAAAPDGDDSEGPEDAAAAAGAGEVTGSKPKARSASAAPGEGGDGSGSGSEDYEARCRAAGMPQIVFRLSADATEAPGQVRRCSKEVLQGPGSFANLCIDWSLAGMSRCVLWRLGT